MSDPLRTDASRQHVGASASERETKIEQLLLAGLDHYFATEYAEAINVWTRALFLDRNHARARAYIERARSALAERMRESEEMLENGVAAFTRGEPDEARRLLNLALNSGAPADEALAVLSRLDRLDQQPSTDRAQGGRCAHRADPRPVERSRRWTTAVAWTSLGVLAIAGAVFAITTRPLWRSLFSPATPGPAVSAPFVAQDAELPLPRRGEMAFARAQALATTGRLRDALVALDGVRSTDPEKAQADRLRAEIQHQLIALGTSQSRPDRDGADLR